MAFVKIAGVGEVAPGSMKKSIIGGKEYLVVNLGGKFYAMDNRCAHMQGDLSAGTLEGNVVTCPRHGSQYDVTNGKGLRGPKIVFARLAPYTMKTYVTRVEGESVLADL
jgi:3-phenylpropionate/trans-cinnamate dioxygenase ferredoxin component